MGLALLMLVVLGAVDLVALWNEPRGPEAIVLVVLVALVVGLVLPWPNDGARWP